MFWLLWLAPVAALLSCRGCEKTEQAPQPPPLRVEFELPDAGLPEGLEFGPAETEPWLRHAGSTDFENRYAAAVLIDNKAAVPCSGVLAGPRLVLTAASCANGPHAQRVSMTTVVYEGDAGPDPQVRHTVLRSYEGRVRAHPSADLAAIFLNEPVPERLAPASLARTEVQQGELLVMAGYGADEFRKQKHDVRYSRKNKATRPPVPGDDRILYEQQGAYVYEGFAGGPCFREGQEGRALVGIAGPGSEKGLSCTSLQAHREWVQAALLEAERGSASPP